MRLAAEPIYPGGHHQPPSITIRHLRFDPDRPHPYQQAPGHYSGCATCGGSWRHPLHIEPLGGWGT